LSWDGDDDSITLSPTNPGLENFDIGVDNNFSAFQLSVSSISGTAEVLLEIFSGDGADSSRVAAVISGTGDHNFGFSELTRNLGAGADLTAVDAITLDIFSSGASSLSIDHLKVVGGQVVAQKAAVDGEGSPITTVSPGDSLAYKVTITSNGGDAQGVQYGDTLDPNTSLSGPVTVSPLAMRDLFVGSVNTQLAVPGPGVLGNDLDLDGGSVSVTTVAPISTVQGGTVTLAADGSFVYDPPAGFTGVDSFSYGIEDDESESDTGTVAVLVE